MLLPVLSELSAKPKFGVAAVPPLGERFAINEIYRFEPLGTASFKSAPKNPALSTTVAVKPVFDSLDIEASVPVPELSTVKLPAKSFPSLYKP